MDKKKKTAVIAAFLLVTFGGATVLTQFGQITSDVEVEQAVTLTGGNCADSVCTETATVYGGETETSEVYTLTSKTTADAPIQVANSVDPDDAGITQKNIYLLSAPGDGQNGTEDRIRISASDTGVSTLADLTSASFMQYVTAGYIGHLDVMLDTDGDGELDDALVFEYDKEQSPSDQTVADMAYTRNAWVDTFDDKGSIDDTSSAWLATGAPGPVGGAGFIYGTLAEWKAGTVDASVDGTTDVLAFEFEIDNWIEASEEKVKDIQVNGAAVDLPTLQAKRTLDFQVATEFGVEHEGSYTIESVVDIR